MSVPGPQKYAKLWPFARWVVFGGCGTLFYILLGVQVPFGSILGQLSFGSCDIAPAKGLVPKWGLLVGDSFDCEVYSLHRRP